MQVQAGVNPGRDRSTTVMTSSGGMIVSALSVMEAMLTSRSERFSLATKPMSQPSEKR